MLPSFNEVKSAASASIASLEQVRQEIRKRNAKRNIRLLIAAAVVLVTIVFVPLFIVCGIALCIYAIVDATRRHKDSAHYQMEFKHRVVAPFAPRMVELSKLPNETHKHAYTISYHPESRLHDNWIYGSRLFTMLIHEIHGEDLFVGRLGLTDFQFSELRLVHEYETTDSKGNTTKHKMDIFKGIMFIADFHKDFNGVTILEAQTAFTRTFVGRTLRKAVNIMPGMQRDATLPIKLESEQFNRAFHVRTSDEQKARYLLSSSMMERILAFRQQHKGHIAISFVDSFMCVAISSSKNYFQAKRRQPADGPHLEEIYNDLRFFFSLVEDFDLNTRIWNKY